MIFFHAHVWLIFSLGPLFSVLVLRYRLILFRFLFIWHDFLLGFKVHILSQTDTHLPEQHQPTCSFTAPNRSYTSKISKPLRKNSSAFISEDVPDSFELRNPKYPGFSLLTLQKNLSIVLFRKITPLYELIKVQGMFKLHTKDDI